MAIADGNWVTPATIVAPRGASLLDGSPWLAQPPIVGICSGVGGGNANVLWDNGFTSSTVPTGSLIQLDKAQSASVTGFSGQVVRRISNNQSGEFIGVPVLIAGMFLAADDQSPTDFAVVKSKGPGNQYWAALISDLEVVEGQ